jgi:hypothetical protein
LFLSDIRVEFKKLDKNERAEMAKQSKPIVEMINGGSE